MANKIDYFTAFLSKDDLECMFGLWKKNLLGDIYMVVNFPWRHRALASTVLTVVTYYFLFWFSRLTFRRLVSYSYVDNAVAANYEAPLELAGTLVNTASEITSSYYSDDPEWKNNYQTLNYNVMHWLELINEANPRNKIATFNGRNVFAQGLKLACRNIIFAERQYYKSTSKVYWTNIFPSSTSNMLKIAKFRLSTLRNRTDFDWKDFYEQRSSGRDAVGKAFVNPQSNLTFPKTEVLAFNTNLFETVGLQMTTSEAETIENAFFSEIKNQLVAGRSVSLRIHPNSSRLNSYATTKLNLKLSELQRYENLMIISANENCNVYSLFSEKQLIISMGSTIAIEAYYHTNNCTVIDTNPHGVHNTLMRENKNGMFNKQALHILSLISTGHAFK